MALKPSDRYSTPRALAEDLDRWIADEPITAVAETLGRALARWGRRHRPWVRAGIASLAIICAISIGSAVLVRGSQLRETASLRKCRVDSARLASDRAFALFDQDRPYEGLAWLGRALSYAPADDAPLQRLIRSNLSYWRGYVCPIIQRFDHEGPIYAVAISPDGTKVLTGSEDKTAKLWDAKTGKMLVPPMEHSVAVRHVAFSPAGSRILTLAGPNYTNIGLVQSGVTLA